MALYPVAGNRFYIGGPMADKNGDFTAGDFDDETWLEVDGWETCGALGDAAAEIATDLINRGRTIVQKGTRRAPAMENQFAVIASDPGQTALIAAERTRENYAFRIVGDDAPEGGTPSERMFIGLVMSAQEQGGSANTIKMLSSSIGINSNIVTVPAAS